MRVVFLIVTALFLASAQEYQEGNSHEESNDISETMDMEHWTSTGGCGRTASQHYKIGGGSDAAIEDFPWQASLRDSFHNDEHFCGGSLISSRWILTATSCYLNRPKKGKPFAPRVTTAVFGITSLGDEADAIVRTIRRKDHYFHPDFNADTYEYNAALLKMRKMIKRDDFPRPVCLGEVFDYRVGDVAIATGYGLSQIDPPVRPASLQKVRARIQNDDLCGAALEDTDRGYHPNVQLCTYERRKGVCAEDEGGPLVVYKDDVWIQIGITSSWPENCNDRNVPPRPPTYTEVYNIVRFIRRTIPNPVCRYKDYWR